MGFIAELMTARAINQWALYKMEHSLTLQATSMRNRMNSGDQHAMKTLTTITTVLRSAMDLSELLWLVTLRLLDLTSM